jgi:hypothetical protein
MCNPLSPLKLLGMPSFICEGCNTLLRVVVTGGGCDTNGERGVTMSFICRILIIENRLAISLFIDQVASACLHSPASVRTTLLT